MIATLAILGLVAGGATPANADPADPATTTTTTTSASDTDAATVVTANTDSVATPPDASASVHGTITDPNGTAAIGATVNLVLDDATTLSATTDETGSFAITDIATDEDGVAFTGDVVPAPDIQLSSATFVSESPLLPGEDRAVSLVLEAIVIPETVAGTVSISGIPLVGTSVVAVSEGWPADAPLIFQWLADGTAITGATSATLPLTSAHAGKKLQVVVSATSPGATPISVTSATTAPVTVAPTPTISGSPVVGTALKVSGGVWPSGTTTSIVWRADGAAISGATGATFTPTAAQAGKRITAAVTGKLPTGVSLTQASANTLRVATIGNPTISGTASTGSVLTATPGTWTASATLAYQWLADGVAIAGANAQKFTVTANQSGKTLSVKITASRAEYPTVTKTSAATARSMHFTKPTISGSAVVGSTLTAKAGTWTSGSTLTYVWQANGTTIAGATKSTYVVTAANVGKSITVTVTGKKTSHTTVAQKSSATPLSTKPGTVTVSGSAIAGKTLVATTTGWSSGTTTKLQWYADGVAISGATGTKFVVTSAQSGKAITARVTGSRSAYATATATSKSTARVMLASAPKITGTTKVTSVLTATPGSWTTGTTFTYVWYANGTVIAGATSNKLTLSTAHAGKTIKVAVTGKKTGHTTVALTSAATAAITYPSSFVPSGSGWRTCPSWAPIKGNASSKIYHMPGGAYYDKTNPEVCFATESAAQAAGYRKSKR